MRVALLTSDSREVLRDYASTQPSFGTAPEALMQGFAGIRDLEVHVVSCVQKPVSSPARLAENIWFHALYVPKMGWLRTGYQGCIRAVRHKLQQIQPDVVHGQGTERDCAISAVFSGLPNVITIHGNMRLIAEVNRARPFTFQWCAAKLERVTVPRAGGIVCITRYTQNAVADLARRTWVVPNALDASFFEVNREPMEPNLILCVGNISPRKNQNCFIEALDPLAKAMPLEVMFLGAAPERDEYVREFLALVKERSWCRYGGMANRAQLKALLAKSWALALPSLEDNCPMAVLEASAAGVPVVAGRVGGVPELIEDGRTGLLFNPLDKNEMADTCRRVLEDRALASRLSTEGKRAALSRFHPQQIARQHVDIYRDLLNAAS